MSSHLSKELRKKYKTRTLGLFGNGEMSEIDKRFVIDSFVTSGTLADSINMTKEIYNASLDQFHSVLKPEFRIFIDEWILSKKQQLDNLV